jgi:hypothetical protein
MLHVLVVAWVGHAHSELQEWAGHHLCLKQSVTGAQGLLGVLCILSTLHHARRCMARQLTLGLIISAGLLMSARPCNSGPHSIALTAVVIAGR